MLDDYTECEQVSNFIYIYLSKNASGTTLGIGIKAIRNNEDSY